jgi:hypothetical protein
VRREALLRRVSASPRLARALKHQLIAIEAIRRLNTPAPIELRERIARAIRESLQTPQLRCPTER